MKRILLLVFTFVSVCDLTAQDCNALFKQVTEKVKRERASASSNGFDMVTRILVTMEGGEVHTEKMDVKMSGHKYQYNSLATQMYQDEKTMVVVNTKENTVFISKPLPVSMRQNQFDQMMKLQDSLVNYFVIQSCEKEWGVVEKGTGYYKMVLLPKPKVKNMGVNSIVYWVAVDKMEVRKISIYYGPENASGIKEYEMIIDRIHNSLSQAPFPESAISMVMEGTKLRSAYAGYEVIDKRN